MADVISSGTREVLRMDMAFHQRLRLERMKRGWSLEDLAAKARVDERTIGRWERGERVPRPQSIQGLCDALNMTPVELGLFETYAQRSQKSPPMPVVPLDIADVLADGPDTPEGPEGQDAFPLHLQYAVPKMTAFSGRSAELKELQGWLVTDGCQVVAIVGMGGVGKTSLAAQLATSMRNVFSSVCWCNLQHALPLEQLLPRCIQLFSGRTYPSSLQVEEQITVLLYHMKQHRCLLVLDNLESLLEPNRTSGAFRTGYEAYGTLLQRLGEHEHRSCLLLTSREKPAQLAWLEGSGTCVRSLPLQGVDTKTGRELLQGRDLLGSEVVWERLIGRYAGNPLALKLAAEPIRNLFGGRISRFLREGETFSGNIHDLLEQQLHRLPAREYALVCWLAIEREPVSLEQLRENLIQSFPKHVLQDDLSSLFRRSMVEEYATSLFTLQPVIMEYITTQLVERFVESFSTRQLTPWLEYTLIQAQAPDYVRESQARLLLTPVAQRLLERRSKQDLVRQFQQILEAERHRHPNQSNYLAANVLNLLTAIQADLRGLDCSDLVIWQAHLQVALLHETNFSRATFLASTFMNTSGNVLSVAFSPNRNLLALGTATHEIWLYETAGVTPLATLYGHTDGVWSVAFSPDGQFLASSSDDQQIRLWNVQTRKCEAILRGHTNRIKSIAFSPDGQYLVSGSDDLSARLWSVSSGVCLREFHGHTARIWSVALSPDGQLLATGSTDQSIHLWDVNSGKCLDQLQGHEGWVLSVSFNGDGSLLASGGDDQKIRLWSVASRTVVQVLSGHDSRVRSLAFNADGTRLVSASEDRTLRYWNVKTGACLNVLQGHLHGVRAAAFDPRGTWLVSGADDQSMRIWDVATARALKTIQGYTQRIWSLAFSPDGQCLVSGCEDQKMRLWPISGEAPPRIFQLPGHAMRCVAFSPDGTLLASAGEDRTIRLWNRATETVLRTLSGHKGWIRALAFSPDGTFLASGSEDHSIMLWDTASGRQLRTLSGHTNWIRALSFNQDGTLLASAADDQTVRLWSLPDGACKENWQRHTQQVRAVAFSPDGTLLASAGEDRVIYLWHIQDGAASALSGHTGRIHSLAFSPDGSRLVSGSEDTTVRLWQVQDGSCLQILEPQTGCVRSVVYSPLGNLFASSSDDGPISLWESQSGQLLHTLRNARPYEGMQITDAQGLTDAQKQTLKLLGAYE